MSGDGKASSYQRLSLNGLMGGAIATTRLYLLTGAVPDPDPTLATDGYSNLDLEFVDLLFSADDNGGLASNFTVEVWLYFLSIGAWVHVDTVAGILTTFQWAGAVRGASRIYVKRTAAADPLNELTVTGEGNRY